MRRRTEYRYKQLANILRNQIFTGQIKPGEYLLPEHELSTKYGMSRTSVRKSLDDLVLEGLIEKHVGRGTKVKADLIIEEGNGNVLRILTPDPSFVMDYAFPVILQAFQKEFPHVEVKVVRLPNHQYQKSIQLSDDIGFKPDLVLVTDRQFKRTVHFEQYQEVDTSALPNIKKNMYPKLWKAFEVNGKLLGAPLTFSPVFLTYNEALFQQFKVEMPRIDWTIHDFIRTAAQLTTDTNGDGIIDQYGFSISTSSMRWSVFLLRNGAFQLGRETDLEIVRESLQFIHDLIFRYKVAHIHSMDRDMFGSNPFIFGKAAMALTTLYEMSFWRNNPLGFEPQIAPMPFGKHDSTMMMANAFMIPKKGPTNSLAQKFIQFALNEHVQQEICEKESYLSIFEKVNKRVKSEAFLRKINVHGNLMQNNYFWDEIVTKSDDMEHVQDVMRLFWYGMESAEHTANQWRDIFTK